MSNNMLGTENLRTEEHRGKRTENQDSENLKYREILEFIEEENVEFIRLAYFDVFGKQKNIAIMPGELERAIKNGVSIDGSAVRGFGSDTRSDLFLHQDLSTLSIVPWRPTEGRVCRIFCDICYPDGSMFECDTRQMLKDAVREAASCGLTVKFGSEMEFYVFKRDEYGNVTDQPLDQAGYMDIEPLDGGENLRRDICFALVDMGITPESSHHEQGPGQMEIDFRYSDPLTAADNTSTVKWAVRSICAAGGYAADFSPKPIADKPGNGMHLNISVHSLNDHDTEKEAAKDADNTGGESVQKAGTPDYTDVFMAGILKYIREITLFLNRAPSSYARLGQMEAPRYVSWAVQNRSQLIRIPADPSGRRRIELRSPDPKANPYLAFSLLIYAGLEGVRKNMHPPLPMDINLFTAEASVTDQLTRLPASIEEAEALALDSSFVRRHVPEICLKAYLGQ